MGGGGLGAGAGVGAVMGASEDAVADESAARFGLWSRAAGDRDAPSRRPCISGSPARVGGFWFFLSLLEEASRPPAVPGVVVARLSTAAREGLTAVDWSGVRPTSGGRGGVLGGSSELATRTRAAIARAERTAIRAAVVHLIASRVRLPMRLGQPRRPSWRPPSRGFGPGTPAILRGRFGQADP